MNSVSADEGGGPLPIGIVGGGVSGLSLAYFLHRAGCRVQVYEANPQLGGNVRTERHDGFVYDVGPDSFLRTKPQALELCRELGLGEELVTPQPQGQKVYVAHEGSLHPMPDGLALGVPTSLSGLLDTSLLSGMGKLRALCEPFVTTPPQSHESILDFSRRRLGTEMADRVVAPLLSGVFAGDPARLGIEDAFPQLVALERKWGSLFRGMTGGRSSWSSVLRSPEKRDSPFVSLRGGLIRLIETLEERLPRRDVHCSTSIESMTWPEGPDGPIELAGKAKGGAAFRARVCHLAVAGPPWAAAPLLTGPAPELGRELRGVRGCPTATVFFGLDTRHVERSLEGSGFIVPAGEGDILAVTWISSKWPGRAPSERALVRAFVGGARGGENLLRRDDELIDLCRRELERLMGPIGPARFARVFRYQRGTPQPEVGHSQRLERIFGLLQELPEVSLLGAGYGGVGIPDCVRQARQLAEELAEKLAPNPAAGA